MSHRPGSGGTRGIGRTVDGLDIARNAGERDVDGAGISFPGVASPRPGLTGRVYGDTSPAVGSVS